MSNDSIQRPRGIRKVSELITQPGRALIITEENAAKYEWDKIPFGTIKVNEQTGIMSMKLKGALLTADGHVLESASIKDDKVIHTVTGDPYYKPGTQTQYKASEIKATSETSWLPAGIKNDGTLCIAKDTMIIEEIFTLVNTSTVVNGEEHCTYKNTEGEVRTCRKYNNKLTFQLEKGEYQNQRNHLEVWIDDVLRRNASTGGVIEINNRTFALEESLKAGQEITVRYYRIMRIGNPYPRFFLVNGTPEGAEEGDFWLSNENLSDYDPAVDAKGEILKQIPWSRITGTPTSLKGYRISDKVSYQGHHHTIKEISDFPTSMPANGGNANTLQNRTIGTNPGNIVILDDFGKIPGSLIKVEQVARSNINGFYSSPASPSKTNEGDIWFDTNERLIKFRRGSSWIPFTAVWKNS